MRDCFSLDFQNKCKFDIDDLLFEVESIIPKLKKWEMHSSVIKDNNYNAVCKEVLNDNNETSGFSIDVMTLEDRFQILLGENFISVKKNYCIEEKPICESYLVISDGEKVFRFCSYQADRSCNFFNETLSINDLENKKESLVDICKNLNQNSSNKKRVRYN